MRQHELHIMTQRGDAQKPAKYPKYHRRDDPESDGDSNVPQHLADGMPTISKNNQDRRAFTQHVRHYKNEQEPFKENRSHIEVHSIRINCCAQLSCKNPSPVCPSTQSGEHHNRVDWASDLRIAVRRLSQSRSLRDYLIS